MRFCGVKNSLYILFALATLVVGVSMDAHAQVAANDGVIFGSSPLRGSDTALSNGVGGNDGQRVRRQTIRRDEPDEADEAAADEEEDEPPIELGRNVSNLPVQREFRNTRVGATPGDDGSTGRTNIAVQPEQIGNQAGPEADPFEQNGLRLGTSDVLLSLEQSIGYSSNVSQIAGGDGGAFSQTDIEAELTSDWSRHQWQTQLNGSYRRPFDSEEVEDLDFSFNSELRLDLIDGHTLTGGVNYNVNTQEFTSTTLEPGAVDTPINETYGADIELERSDRKLRFLLRGFIQQNEFEDAELGGGLVQDQEDQNNTRFGGALRVGYEVSPAIIPFAEVEYSIRDFETGVDRNGNNRDSDIFELRGGIQYDFGEKLQGEIAGGFLTEQFDDPFLEDLTGFTLNGALNWSPERDTLVSLSVGTDTNNSITLNENGTFIYTGQLDYARQLNSRWSMDAFVGLTFETNEENNRTFAAGVGMQYWVNRFMALTGDVEYLSFSSDAPDNSFDEFSARVGVRLQR